MNIVRVLVEGYARLSENGIYLASPTTSLVESNGVKFLVDPGTNEEKLKSAMEENNILEKDISFIYLSHWHPDHFLNIRLFPTLDVYDGEICWSNHKEITHGGKLPGVDGVEIIKTPGHSPEHSSLLVDTKEGKTCIAQDVFWWEDGKQKTQNCEDLIDLVDPFMTDKEALTASRKLVLKKSDFVIPGHGKIFKVRPECK